MKQYDTFASEGGYRYAGSMHPAGPVMDTSPWFETKPEAQRAADEQRERDQQQLHADNAFICEECGRRYDKDEELHDVGDGRDLCEKCFCKLVD